jgi:hypothetical protein
MKKSTKNGFKSTFCKPFNMDTSDFQKLLHQQLSKSFESMELSWTTPTPACQESWDN